MLPVLTLPGNRPAGG